VNQEQWNNRKRKGWQYGKLPGEGYYWVVLGSNVSIIRVSGLHPEVLYFGSNRAMTLEEFGEGWYRKLRVPYEP